MGRLGKILKDIMTTIKLLDSTNFSRLQSKYLEKFTSSYGNRVASFRLIKQTDHSFLFELVLTDGSLHQRLVVGTYDELPGSVDLIEYGKYFDKSPVLDSTKSIQIIKFSNKDKIEDSKFYGFNPYAFIKTKE